MENIDYSNEGTVAFRVAGPFLNKPIYCDKKQSVILPSEKAKAYKMKLDALKRQGARTDLTSDHAGQKSDKKSTRDLIAADSPDSSTQIQRFVRLNELIPELMEMVDLGRVALTPAVELSYLSKEEQDIVALTIESEQATPSLSQAQRMRKLSRAGALEDDTVLTNLIFAGVDPKTVQYLAGHENSKITMDIYAKVKYNDPDSLSAIVNTAMDKIYAS